MSRFCSQRKEIQTASSLHKLTQTSSNWFKLVQSHSDFLICIYLDCFAHVFQLALVSICVHVVHGIRSKLQAAGYNGKLCDSENQCRLWK